MSELLNTSSTMMCPHGGSVSAVTSNAVAKAGGDFIVRLGDTYTVSGCAFTLPNGTPHPCVRVQWTTSALMCKAANDTPLNKDSQGLCLAADSAPQGSVQITNTQTQVKGN